MSLYLKHFYESIQNAQYFQIGSFKKPYGINGAIMASFIYKIDDIALIKLPAFFVEIDHVKVPYAVEHITFTSHKTIIKLLLIQSKIEAYVLSNLPLFIPLSIEPILIATPTPYNFMIGFLVNDVILGSLGKIQAIYSVRDQYMIGVDCQEKELLIPYHQPFVVNIDRQQKQVSVELPAGYLEAML